MQDKQRGYIGINIFAFGLLPLTNSTEDAIATQRYYDFLIGWYDKNLYVLGSLLGLSSPYIATFSFNLIVLNFSCNSYLCMY